MGVAAPHSFDLEISGPDGTRLMQRLLGPTLSIGRADNNQVVLKHDDVSRRHAVVEIGPGGMVVRDVSTNGTFVDGRRVPPQAELPLPLGRQIKVGPYLLRFRAAGTGPQPVISGEAAVASRPVHEELAAPSVVAEGAVVVDGEPLVERVDPPVARPAARGRPQGGHSAAPVHDPPGRAPAHARSPAPGARPARPTVQHSAVAPPAPPLRAVAVAAPAHGAPHAQGHGGARKPDARRLAPVAEAPAPSAAPSDVSDGERDRLKRWLKGLLLEALDLPSLRPEELQDKALGPRVLRLMDELLDEHARELPRGLDRGRLRKELADEVLGLGPLEDMLNDEGVTEVMVVDRATIYVERAGRLELTGARFSSDDALRSAIERIVTPLGRRIDESTPMVDARLKDGSRVNAIIPPLALRGPCVTIRKFSKRKLELSDLVGYGSLDERMGRFLLRSVIARRNILVSGGTGSGKTTLLNVLSSAIPEEERIVTIEDAAELKLHQPHVVSLETRPANMEGRGEFTIRDLVRNALRMRPDRIIVGECRGGEALDMLQAMNTGHDGSLTTTHANSPEEAIARLETLVLMAGIDLPTRAIREQIANSIHLVVQQARFVDGSRKITQVSEVVGLEEDGTVQLESIFEFHRLPGERGRVDGEFRATGYLPSFVTDFITMGLVTDGEFL